MTAGTSCPTHLRWVPTGTRCPGCVEEDQAAELAAADPAAALEQGKLGWRCWRVDKAGRLWPPMPTAVQRPWQEGRINVAACNWRTRSRDPEHGPAPARKCTCGIAAVAELPILLRYLEGGWRGSRWVVGQVRYGGLVRPGMATWGLFSDPPGTVRAQYAERVGDVVDFRDLREGGRAPMNRAERREAERAAGPGANRAQPLPYPMPAAFSQAGPAPTS